MLLLESSSNERTGVTAVTENVDGYVVSRLAVVDLLTAVVKGTLGGDQP